MAEFSGSIRITAGDENKYSLILKCFEDSYSIENNTSRVYWWVGIRSNTQYHAFNSVPQHYKVVVNGTTVLDKDFTLTCGKGQTLGVKDGYITVTHNADGSKSISASASFSCSNTQYYSPRSGSCSGTVNLTTIPRATTPSINKPSLDCGNTITISGTSASSNFSHKVYVKWNGTTTYLGTIASGTTSPSFSYTIPTDWEKNLPNSTSGIATFTLETFSGSTSVGSKSVNATIKVRSGVVPSIGTISISDTNSICAGIGQIVQSQSALKFAISASGSQGSSISSISTRFNSADYIGSNFTTSTIYASGTINYTTTVTDSRGRTASKSGSVTVVPYSRPSMTNISAKRANSSYVIDEASGTYALLHFKVGFTSLSGKNVTSFYIQYRVSGTSSWTKINSWDNNYTLEQDYKAGNLFTSTTATYEVAFGVKDKFMNDYSWNIFTVTPTYTLINFGKDGKSLTFFGQDANNANRLTINGKLQTKDFSINGKWETGYRCSGGGNSSTYMRLCRLKIKTTYINNPIELCYSQRASPSLTVLEIGFANSSSLDPSLMYFRYRGYCRNAFIVKVSTSTWDIYVTKAESFDTIAIHYWTCLNADTDIELQFIGENATSVPNGRTQAANFYMEELRSKLFPVGAIYTTYNNNNPGNFLGGTWVQIGQGRTLIGQGTGNDGTKSMSFSQATTGGKYRSDQLNCGGSSMGLPTSSNYADRTIVRATAISSKHNEINAEISLVQPYEVVYFWRRTA